MVRFFGRTNRTELTDRQKLKRDLSEEVYKNPQQRRTQINNYFLDKNYNDKRFAVYREPIGKEVIFVVRGTADIKDVLSDLRLIQQQLTGRGFNLNEILNKFLTVYDVYSKQGYTIRLTAHSLGGYEVIKLTQREGDKVDSGVVFNAGSIPIQKDKIPEEIEHLRSPNDLVSLGWRNDKQSKNVYRDVSRFNLLGNHSITYFK
jgi:hypothetical protein